MTKLPGGSIHKLRHGGARVPQRKRFYANAAVIDTQGGFAVTLNGKLIRTHAMLWSKRHRVYGIRRSGNDCPLRRNLMGKERQ
ncbi:MAG: hypothetical protein JOY77_01135 [Alphaproteobacteria bacterium]|nr:hypothetical protein [Alphaproteobacteria bacterium]